MKIQSNFSMPEQVNKIANNKNKNDETQFKAILKQAYDEKDKAKLKEACKQMESLFVGMMYKQMRGTVPESGFIPKSFARQTFESMLDEEFAKQASEGQGIGLSKMLYEQLSREMDNTYVSSNNESKGSKAEEDHNT